MNLKLLLLCVPSNPCIMRQRHKIKLGNFLIIVRVLLNCITISTKTPNFLAGDDPNLVYVIKLFLSIYDNKQHCLGPHNLCQFIVVAMSRCLIDILTKKKLNNVHP